MTTLIFVENVLGSGQVVKLTEDFDIYTVSRDLMPGENTRLVVSAFKTISVEEVPTAAAAANDGRLATLAAAHARARRYC